MRCLHRYFPRGSHMSTQTFSVSMAGAAVGARGTRRSPGPSAERCCARCWCLLCCPLYLTSQGRFLLFLLEGEGAGAACRMCYLLLRTGEEPRRGTLHPSFAQLLVGQAPCATCRDAAGTAVGSILQPQLSSVTYIAQASSFHMQTREF